MLNKLIIHLVCKKLNIHKYEMFQFTNQKDDGIYWFSKTRLIKMINGKMKSSGVSLNWLLSEECKIIFVD